MIIQDKKKTAALIVSKFKPDGSTSEQSLKPETEMDPNSESLKAIAEDVMQAIKDGSAHDLMTALKAFMSNSDQD